mgnify:CR=1 FL=1
MLFGAFFTGVTLSLITDGELPCKKISDNITEKERKELSAPFRYDIFEMSNYYEVFQNHFQFHYYYNHGPPVTTNYFPFANDEVERNFKFKVKTLTKLVADNIFPYQVNCFYNNKGGFLVFVSDKNLIDGNAWTQTITFDLLRMFVLKIVTIVKKLDSINTVFTSWKVGNFMALQNHVAVPYFVSYNSICQMDHPCPISEFDVLTRRVDLQRSPRQIAPIGTHHYIVTAERKWNCFALIWHIKNYFRKFIYAYVPKQNEKFIEMFAAKKSLFTDSICNSKNNEEAFTKIEQLILNIKESDLISGGIRRTEFPDSHRVDKRYTRSSSSESEGEMDWKRPRSSSNSSMEEHSSSSVESKCGMPLTTTSSSIQPKPKRRATTAISTNQPRAFLSSNSASSSVTAKPTTINTFSSLSTYPQTETSSSATKTPNSSTKTSTTPPRSSSTVVKMETEETIASPLSVPPNTPNPNPSSSQQRRKVTKNANRKKKI